MKIVSKRTVFIAGSMYILSASVYSMDDKTFNQVIEGKVTKHTHGIGFYQAKLDEATALNNISSIQKYEEKVKGHKKKKELFEEIRTYRNDKNTQIGDLRTFSRDVINSTPLTIRLLKEKIKPIEEQNQNTIEQLRTLSTGLLPTTYDDLITSSYKSVRGSVGDNTKRLLNDLGLQHQVNGETQNITYSRVTIPAQQDPNPDQLLNSLKDLHI